MNFNQFLTLWAASMLSIGLVSCMSRHDSVVIDTNPVNWDVAAKLVYKNKDTISIKQVGLLLRYDHTASDGIYVIEARSPSGAKTRDTLDVSLSTDRSSNNIREIRRPYRSHVRLGEEGEYTFTITPPAETCGIWNTGIDFENISTQNGEE